MVRTGFTRRCSPICPFFIHSSFGRSHARHLLCSEGFAVLPYSFILRASHLTYFELVKYPGYLFRRQGRLCRSTILGSAISGSELQDAGGAMHVRIADDEPVLAAFRSAGCRLYSLRNRETDGTASAGERNGMKVLLLGGSVYAAALREAGHTVKPFLHRHCFEDGRQVRHYSLNNAIEHAGFEPDVVMIELFGARPFVRGLEDCPYPLVSYCFDSSFNHFWTRHYFKLFDVVFVDFKDSQPRLAEEGIEAHWLPYAIHPPDFGPFDLPKRWDIAFVGVTDHRPRREALIQTLREHFNVHAAGGLKGKERLTHRQMAEVYAQARLVVNEYLFDGVNFRVFEAMGAGTMLLTEYTENGLFDLFEDGRHLVTYTPDTLIEKVRYYLEHEEERERIARAGFEETMAQHTRRDRVETMLEVLGDLPGKRMERDVVERIGVQSKAFYHFSLRWPDYAPELFTRANEQMKHAILQRRDRADYHALFARLHGVHGDRSLALEAMKHAVQLDHEDPLLHFHLGHLLLALDRSDDAAPAFQHGLVLLKGLGDDVIRPAMLQFERKRFDAETWYRMGRVFDAWGRRAEPNDSRHDERLFPDNATHYYILAYRANRHQKALIALGDLYSQAGIVPFAMDCYLAALDQQPHDADLMRKAGHESRRIFRLRESAALLQAADTLQR
ncbi:glycosyltransferase [bacterium]|nr:glycosyltransferase [bacterium]